MKRHAAQEKQKQPAARPLRVLFVTPELAPWCKVGGLGEISRDLPAALAQHAGCDVRQLVPAYPALRDAFPAAEQLTPLMAFGGRFAPARLMAVFTTVPTYLVDCPAYFNRPGNAYQSPAGEDWPDNHLRFGLLSHVAALLGSAASPFDWRPDVIHCQDWQSGPVAAYLGQAPRARAATVLTIHNLAYQGIFPARAFDDLGFPAGAGIDGFEYYGNVSFLKVGLKHATKLTTVSPTYAREILTPGHGCGLDGVLRSRGDEIVGILNGINVDLWDPARDPHLAQSYGPDRLERKGVNKSALQRALGLPERDDIPLLGVVARLVDQKGLDLVIEAAAGIVGLPAQLVIHGQGEHEIEAALRALAARHPSAIAVRIGFDEHLAHRVAAGADIFLVPSRFEPCGLTPMQAARCGTPSVAHGTGGLADSIVDATPANLDAHVATGFVFDRPAPDAFLDAIQRALGIYRDPALWRTVQQAAMARDFSWTSAVPAYMGVYRGALSAQSSAAQQIWVA
ncbi:MAG: glycogen synthase GlgA [Burkholderiales bacterium]